MRDSRSSARCRAARASATAPSASVGGDRARDESGGRAHGKHHRGIVEDPGHQVGEGIGRPDPRPGDGHSRNRGAQHPRELGRPCQPHHPLGTQRRRAAWHQPGGAHQLEGHEIGLGYDHPAGAPATGSRRSSSTVPWSSATGPRSSGAGFSSAQTSRRGSPPRPGGPDPHRPRPSIEHLGPVRPQPRPGVEHGQPPALPALEGLIDLVRSDDLDIGDRGDWTARSASSGSASVRDPPGATTTTTPSSGRSSSGTTRSSTDVGVSGT